MKNQDPFKQPLAPKEKKSSKNFAAPSKEQATTGRFMPAGTNYGVGFKQPVGRMRASPMQDGPIPQKSKRISPESVV